MKKYTELLVFPLSNRDMWISKKNGRKQTNLEGRQG